MATPTTTDAEVAHRTTIHVRFAELDPYAHVNHAVYVTYFEVARTEALAEVGLGLDHLARQGFQFVVTDLSVRYRRAAGAGDTLTIETGVVKVSRASSVWRQRITRPVAEGEPELLVEAELKIGVTDRRGRPAKPPAWIFEALAPLVNEAAD
mgnify:FL=1